MAEKIKKLYRSRNDKVIAGIAGGLGEYFDIDPVLIRVLFVALLFAGGVSIPLYIILILVVPLEPKKGEEGAKGDVQEKVQKAAKDLKKSSNNVSAGNIIGLVVFLIGLVLLMNRIFPLSFRWFGMDLLWPIIVIIIGLVLFFKK
ncbi:MAG: PspC domain-containing protein [Candidatus Portnoybacteria bacterium]|nr:PspC domain-containing protein [Candidatus Portnoybacteria bacterium]